MAAHLPPATFIPEPHQLARAASTLRAMAAPPRLLVLCKLLQHGELNVGELATEVDLSQSALSQHLAKLRDSGLVATRKTGTSVYYRLEGEDVRRIIATLYDLYCAG